MSAFDSAISVPALSTGTSLMVGSKQLANNQQQATPMSAMDSVKELFLDMRDTLQQIAENTFATNELLKDPNAKRENRDEKIGRSETDVSPPAEEKGPGILASLGNTLSNLNPFKDGMSPIMKFLLAGAALIGLRVFGEKLNEPLANLVKMFKEGTIVDNIKKTVENIKKDLEPIILEIKEKIGLFIEGVKKVKDLIVKAYEMVENYVMQFDTDGDGKLDETETKLLKEDVIKNLSEAISAVLGNIVETVVAAFGIYTVGSVALKFILARAGFGVASVGAGAIGATVFSVAAIAAVVAAGVFKLADNAATAFEDATTDEFGNQQDFSAKEFVARLLGGKNTEGGWMNAIMNAWDKALIGAAAGAVAGTVVPGLGTGIGAALGFIVGGVSGALLGKEGSDGIAEFIDMVNTGFSDLMSDIGSWFSETWTGIKNAVTGNDEVYIDKNKLKLDRKINEAEAYKQSMDEYQAIHGEYKVGGFMDKKYKKNLKKIEELNTKIFAADNPELYTAQIKAKNIQEQIDQREGDITTLKNMLDPELNPTLNLFQKKEFEKTLEMLEKERDELVTDKLKIETDAGITPSMTIRKDVMPNKFEDIKSMEGKSFLFTPINNNSNNTNIQKQETNAYTGGLTQDNPHFTALIMAHNKAKTT
jgi:hypothetical protein